MFASVLRRALSRRGYCAHWAADGEAALAALKETAPSHIVLDLNLAAKVVCACCRTCASRRHRR